MLVLTPHTYASPLKSIFIFLFDHFKTILNSVKTEKAKFIVLVSFEYHVELQLKHLYVHSFNITGLIFVSFIYTALYRERVMYLFLYNVRGLIDDVRFSN